MELQIMNNFYVYVYKDPKTLQPFYIGKGSNYRAYVHLRTKNWKSPQTTTNPFFFFKIKSIMQTNERPVIEKLFENLSEQEAYQKENELIIFYGRKFGPERGILLNISSDKGTINIRKKPQIWSEIRKKEFRATCKKNRKYDPTFDELFDDYIIKNKTREKIAIENKVSVVLVKKRLQFFGIIKPKDLRYSTKNKFVCDICKSIFERPNSIKQAKYCSRKCYDTKRSSRIPNVKNE